LFTGKSLSLHLINNYGEPQPLSKTASRMTPVLSVEETEERIAQQGEFLRGIAEQANEG
jgi:hypothetical protein